MQQQCPKCGSVIPPTIQASFCGECGASLILDISTDKPSSELDANIHKPVSELVASTYAPASEPDTNIYEHVSEPVASSYEPSFDLVKKNYDISLDSITRELAEDLIKDLIKQKLIEESKFRILGLECLKCGSRSSLTLFTHSETVRISSKYSTTYRTRSNRIPVCNNCSLELISWTNKNSTSRASYYNVVCGMIFGLILIGVFSSILPWVSLLMILIFVIGCLYTGSKLAIRNQSNSPFRYIKFRGKQTFVRPRGTGNWIKYDLWLRQLSPRI